MPFSARQGFFGGNLWTPADTSTVVWLHVDTEDSYEVSNISGVNRITTWYNQSGTDFVNNTSDAPNLPPGGNAAVVGIGIEFASDEYLEANTTFLSNTNPNFMCVMMCDFNDNDFGGQNYAISVGQGNGSIKLGLSDQDLPANISWQHENGFSDHGTITGDGYNSGRIMTSWQRSSGTDYSDDAAWLFGNVSARTSSANLTTSPNITGNSRVGQGVIFGYAGTIREIVIAESDDDNIRQKLEGYMAWKYSDVDELPASHPYKDGPPTT